MGPFEGWRVPEWEGYPHPPVLLDRCQNKELANWAIRKCMKRKGGQRVGLLARSDGRKKKEREIVGDTREFTQERILKGLRASQFVSGESKGVAVTTFSSRDAGEGT